MPTEAYALCPRRPMHVGYLMLLRKAILYSQDLYASTRSRRLTEPIGEHPNSIKSVF